MTFWLGQFSDAGYRIILLVIVSVILSQSVTHILNRSPTSQSCHQHISSPTSVTRFQSYHKFDEQHEQLALFTENNTFIEPGNDDEAYGNKYSSKWVQFNFDLIRFLADIESLYPWECSPEVNETFEVLEHLQYKVLNTRRVVKCMDTYFRIRPILRSIDTPNVPSRSPSNDNPVLNRTNRWLGFW